MPTFKDAHGREWLIKIDAPTIREVRQTCGVDLAAPHGRDYLRLAADPVLLVDTLWVLLRKQSQAAGVSDEQFGQALYGDALDSAAESLLHAIADFFPIRQRNAVLALAAKDRAVTEAGWKISLEKITDPVLTAKIETAMAERIEAEIAAMLTQLNSVTSSPAGVASAPPG